MVSYNPHRTGHALIPKQFFFFLLLKLLFNKKTSLHPKARSFQLKFDQYDLHPDSRNVARPNPGGHDGMMAGIA